MTSWLYSITVASFCHDFSKKSTKWEYISFLGIIVKQISRFCCMRTEIKKIHLFAYTIIKVRIKYTFNFIMLWVCKNKFVMLYINHLYAEHKLGSISDGRRGGELRQAQGGHRTSTKFAEWPTIIIITWVRPFYDRNFRFI